MRYCIKTLWILYRGTNPLITQIRSAAASRLPQFGPFSFSFDASQLRPPRVFSLKQNTRYAHEHNLGAQ